MKSTDLIIENFEKENPLDTDLKYLEELVLSSSSDHLYGILSDENWFLWKEKGKYEDLILKDLYNTEYNFRAYIYEVAICRRICILKALNKLQGRSLISVHQAFRMFPPDTMIEELTKPLDRQVLSSMGESLKIFGRGKTSSVEGDMKCICTDEHDEVLYYWLKARKSGILNSDHILLHFDAHSDMTSIDSLDMKIISAIDDPEEFKNYITTCYSLSPGKNLITPVDLVSFIYCAVKKDLIREIFWVYPDPDYCKYRFPANLDRSYIFDIDGGENFRLETGHIVCDWAGIKVHILRLGDLPLFNEEVILDIDMDFFLNQSSADSRAGCRGYRVWDRESLETWKKICSHPLRLGDLIPWITPDKFISTLKDKKINSLITTVALSPFFTESSYHFLIDTISEKLSEFNSSGF